MTPKQRAEFAAFRRTRPTQEQIVEFTRKLTDEGLLIEAGWLGLQLAAIPEDAPSVQLEEMRNAFFAGAAHLFHTVMSIMDSDREPTEADLRRVGQVHEELQRFDRAFRAKHGM